MCLKYNTSGVLEVYLFMKKILFLVSSMQAGGAERVASLLCNYWAQKGHDVTLMPTFSGGGECVYPLDSRVRLDYLADRVNGRSGTIIHKLYRLSRLRAAIKELTPDVVVSFLSDVNIAAIIATAGMKIPVVVSERSYPPAMPLGYFLDKARSWAYPRAKAVVVQTDKTATWLERECPNTNGVVIPNPVVYPLPSSFPKVSPWPVQAGSSMVVLAVGRLSPEKQFDYLIDAFYKASDKSQDAHLVILGEGPERGNLERQRDRLGLTGRVHLPGRVGNLADWYSNASFYVISSRFEGFPNTLVEAMSYGLPAVSFDCDTGPKEIIAHGVNGFLVDPEEGVPGLASVIGEMIENDVLRLKLAGAAVLVRSRFGIDKIGLRWDITLGLCD